VRFIKLNPSQLLIVVFLLFIVFGTILLKLPIATESSIMWIDALFTATSAMTVTGLASVDPGSTFTIFGEVVILVLIQAGGLGIMSLAVLIFMVLGKKIGLKERLLIQHSLNYTSIGGVIKLVRNLFFYSIAIEFFATIILSIRWVPEYGWGKGIYYSLFHSISAFNNAGFSIWPDNLTRFVGDPIVNMVISSLFIIGGIGFTVLVDIFHKRDIKKWSLHTKLMIYGTILINTIAFLVVLFLEINNANTIGSYSWIDKIWASYFQAVSPRTAGFNTVDIGALHEGTITFMILLMFIGAGSTSTGGGIKLTTFIVIVLSVWTFLKEKNHITIANRTIKDKIIIRSLAILTISVAFIFLNVLLLNIFEPLPFLNILFEVVSAFGTVGLSMGITPDLSFYGKLIIIFTMFLGKIGPLTLAFSLARPGQEILRYPSEDVLTG